MRPATFVNIPMRLGVDSKWRFWDEDWLRCGFWWSFPPPCVFNICLALGEVCLRECLFLHSISVTLESQKSVIAVKLLSLLPAFNMSLQNITGLILALATFWFVWSLLVFYQVSSDFSFEITFCADMILQFMMFHWVFPFGHVRTEVTFHILFINMIASCVSLQSAVGRRGKLAKIAFQIRFHFMFCFNVHFKMTLLHWEHIRPVHKNLFLEFPKYPGRFMLHFDI